MADLFERRTIQDRDAFVRAVRDVDETLLRIGRQRNAECRACSLRFTLDEPFLQEFAVQGERLDAVVRAISYIHDAVVGDLDAVRGVELLRSRTARLARLRRLVVGLVAVSTPVALVGAGVGVEHDDTAVAVAVGDKHLVGLVIHGDARRPAQVCYVVAVDGNAAFADLDEGFDHLLLHVRVAQRENQAGDGGESVGADVSQGSGRALLEVHVLVLKCVP